MTNLFDFIKSIFESGKERLRSPFLRAFSISFLIFNWKAWYTVLFTNLSIDQKVEKVREWSHTISTAVGIPILVALVFTICLPILLALIDWLIIRAVIFRNNFNGRIKIKKLEQNIEIARLEYQIEINKAGKEDIARLNQKIKLLSKDKDQSEQRNVKLEKENITLKERFEKYENENIRNSELLTLINKSKVSDYFKYKSNGMLLELEKIQKNLKEGELLNNFDPSKIKNLKDANLLKQTNENSKDEKSHFSLTDKGNFMLYLYYNELYPMELRSSIDIPKPNS